VCADENGEYDDWIELHNSTDLPLNVGGLCLTDNLNVPCKYLIPTHSPALTTIPARGYLLLWSDGQPDQGILHVNFKLDKAGEEIGLVQITDTDTVFVDSLTYGEQTTDISFGRSPDGAETWRLFETPTPLSSNQPTRVETVDHSLPATYALFQNHPNPFNLTTAIRYALPVLSQVKLNVYDLLGREVMTLVNQRQPAGRYTVIFEALALPSGIYFYRIQTPAFTQTKKAVFMR